jgi:hypothetical protein
MENKDSIKIKYLIGAFRDSTDFPTLEDAEYLIKNWYWNEGGQHFIHTVRGIPESTGPVFVDNILTEKLNGEEKTAKGLLDSLLVNNKIKINKSTKFTTYYEFI